MTGSLIFDMRCKYIIQDAKVLWSGLEYAKTSINSGEGTPTEHVHL